VVTPAKRTISQAALTPSPARQGSSKQRIISTVASQAQGSRTIGRPAYTTAQINLDSPQPTAVGPLQAYANPSHDRQASTGSSPSARSGPTPTKITLKLPGQSQLSARIASARAGSTGFESVPLHPTKSSMDHSVDNLDRARAQP
jgi:hypothetical protein